MRIVMLLSALHLSHCVLSSTQHTAVTSTVPGRTGDPTPVAAPPQTAPVAPPVVSPPPPVDPPASGGGSSAGSTSGNPPSTGTGLAANPIISRAKPVYDYTGVHGSTTHPINDGQYGSWSGVWRNTPNTSSVANPIWASINLGSGFGDVLLVWAISWTPDYCDSAPSDNLLRDYQIQTSSDSTDGANGQWTTVHTEVGNQKRWREHRFSMNGASWVRFNITSGGAGLDEIDIHDLSKGSDDTWIYLGGGDTRMSFDRNSDSRAPTFAMNVHQAHADYFPAMVDIAQNDARVSVALTNSDTCAGTVDDWLALNPDMHFWVLDYGQTEAAGASSPSCDTTGYIAGMRTLVSKVIAAGHVPVIPHIAFVNNGQNACIPAFNSALDTFIASTPGVLPGPNSGSLDRYTWFANHLDQLCAQASNQGSSPYYGCEFADNVRMTDAGKVALNKLWSSAMDTLY